MSKTATKTEIDFVRNIANPANVLAAIQAGHEAVARAMSPLERAAAVAGTWLEIAELEGDDTAETITGSIWPLESNGQLDNELASLAPVMLLQAAA